MAASPPPKNPSQHGFLGQIPHIQRVLVIQNPRSGGGKSEEVQNIRKFCNQLRSQGVQVMIRLIEDQIPISHYVQDIKTFDAVVAAGGDGTISSLAYAVRYQNVPILAYPAGTANLIAQNLDLPKDPYELAQILLTAKPVHVDMGEVETTGHKRGFCMLAGTGIDAAMIRDSEEFKEKFGPMAYVLGALKQFSPVTHDFQLTLDGKTRLFRGIGVMVANFGMANYRLPIIDNISPSDGHLTVILISGDHLLRLFPNLIDSLRVRFKLGDPLFDDNLEVIEAKTVTVRCTSPLPLQYDGELLPDTTPFSAHTLPAAVSFLTYIHPDKLDT